MAVITISRQVGSGGDEIARRVGEILAYQHFDKRLIIKAAAEVGLSEQEIIDYSEESHKVQSFLDRLFGRSPAMPETRVWKEDVTGIRSVEGMQINEDTLLSLVQKAIRSAHATGNRIILGRGGQVVLQDQPDVLHVRIVAPLEERIQRVKEQLRRDRQLYYADIELRRQAQDWIIERDAASDDYLKRFYHVDWDDPTLYHIVLNTCKLPFEQCADIIARMALDLRPMVGTQPVTGAETA